MKAVRTGPDIGIAIREVPIPEPGPGEVLVRVAGAGLCHTDCMVSRAPSHYRPDGTSFTLGHETAGTIAALGEGVRGPATGQPVVVHAEWGCGQCGTCRAGGERFCPAVRPAAGAGLGFDGGLAEYILVPAARNVVPIPEGLDPVDAGPFDDAGLTPYHAIRTSMPWLEAGSVAVVIGVGGLGHVAVQILRAVSTARIVAVEKDERRREFALELGADLAFDPLDDAAARIKAMRRDGASFVIDLVGTDETLSLAGSAAAIQGKVVCMGAGFGSYPFSMTTFPWECVLQSTYAGEAWELERLLHMAAAGRVRIHADHITLDEVPDAYGRLEKGEHGIGRTIAVP
ncbi:alcohol dehydrogenase catalytic domain-containing protein [Streptomyces sp. NPDC004539]|uniref:alcohol dehydrogenase catalytic domain-containing protein n=1 Tax=Streptomyces sp. NPDC004539 TaxID=3154280 RepID=UPI0033AB4A31